MFRKSTSYIRTLNLTHFLMTEIECSSSILKIMALYWRKTIYLWTWQKKAISKSLFLEIFVFYHNRRNCFFVKNCRNIDQGSIGKSENYPIEVWNNIIKHCSSFSAEWMGRVGQLRKHAINKIDYSVNTKIVKNDSESIKVK